MMDIFRNMSIGELRRDAIDHATTPYGEACVCELARRSEAAEAERDRWKAEALAARTCLMRGNSGNPIETYAAWKSARAANGEVPHD